MKMSEVYFDWPRLNQKGKARRLSKFRLALLVRLLQVEKDEAVTARILLQEGAQKSKQEKDALRRRRELKSAEENEIREKKRKTEAEESKRKKDELREAANIVFLQEVNSAHAESLRRADISKQVEAVASGTLGSVYGGNPTEALGARQVRRILGSDDALDRLIRSPLNRAIGSVDVPE